MKAHCEIVINHKGTECQYKPILCQEGYCSDCQIYKDFQGHQRTMGRKLWVGSPNNINNEVCQFCSISRIALKEMIAEGGKENLTMVNTILENCINHC